MLNWTPGGIKWTERRGNWPARSALRGCSGSGQLTRATKAWITWRGENDHHSRINFSFKVEVNMLKVPGQSWWRASSSQQTQLAGRPLNRLWFSTWIFLLNRNLAFNLKHSDHQWWWLNAHWWHTEGVPGPSRQCLDGRSLSWKTPARHMFILCSNVNAQHFQRMEE